MALKQEQAGRKEQERYEECVNIRLTFFSTSAWGMLMMVTGGGRRCAPNASSRVTNGLSDTVADCCVFCFGQREKQISCSSSVAGGAWAVQHLLYRIFQIEISGAKVLMFSFHFLQLRWRWVPEGAKRWWRRSRLIDAGH